ncbi:MAG: N-acetyltransferase [Nitrospira sp.]
MAGLTADFAPYLEEVLRLDDEVCGTYNRFVFASDEEAHAIRELLLRAGCAEFSPPAGQAALEGGRFMGFGAWMAGVDLMKKRLVGARAIGRASAELCAPALAERMVAAATALAVPKKDEWYVARIAVVPGARGKGIGGYLVTQALEEGRRHGCARCVLTVDPENDAAMRLYRKYGFEVIAQPLVHGGVRSPTFSYWHLARTL